MSREAELDVLTRAVTQTREKLTRRAGEARIIATQGQAAEAEVAALEARLELYAKAQALLTSIGEEAQDIARGQIEGLVTNALRVVFGEELSFRLVPGERGGQATVEFILRSEYGTEKVMVDTPVMEARGGGMAAVVGFVLRLVVLLLTPGARRFLALDESFAHVSASYEERVAAFLREVADKAGVQILLVTHSHAYSDHADAQVRLALGPDGVTQVREGESE